MTQLFLKHCERWTYEVWTDCWTKAIGISTNQILLNFKRNIGRFYWRSYFLIDFSTYFCNKSKITFVIRKNNNVGFLCNFVELYIRWAFYICVLSGHDSIILLIQIGCFFFFLCLISQSNAKLYWDRLSFSDNSLV